MSSKVAFQVVPNTPIYAASKTNVESMAEALSYEFKSSLPGLNINFLPTGFKVVIEINSHPKRLDIDWRWVRKALDKGVMLSINPDAHEIAGYQDMYYGVCVGRKGGLTKQQTLNVMSLKEIDAYFTKRKSLI